VPDYPIGQFAMAYGSAPFRGPTIIFTRFLPGAAVPVGLDHEAVAQMFDGWLNGF